MTSAREMRLRIKSVKDLSQVTRALKTVSASKVRKAVTANAASLNYSKKAWQVLQNLAGQPGTLTCTCYSMSTKTLTVCW